MSGLFITDCSIKISIFYELKNEEFAILKYVEKSKQAKARFQLQFSCLKV